MTVRVAGGIGVVTVAVLTVWCVVHQDGKIGESEHGPEREIDIVLGRSEGRKTARDTAYSVGDSVPVGESGVPEMLQVPSLDSLLNLEAERIAEGKLVAVAGGDGGVFRYDPTLQQADGGVTFRASRLPGGFVRQWKDRVVLDWFLRDSDDVARAFEQAEKYGRVLVRAGEYRLVRAVKLTRTGLDVLFDGDAWLRPDLDGDWKPGAVMVRVVADSVVLRGIQIDAEGLIGLQALRLGGAYRAEGLYESIQLLGGTIRNVQTTPDRAAVQMYLCRHCVIRSVQLVNARDKGIAVLGGQSCRVESVQSTGGVVAFYSGEFDDGQHVVPSRGCLFRDLEAYGFERGVMKVSRHAEDTRMENVRVWADDHSPPVKWYFLVQGSFGTVFRNVDVRVKGIARNVRAFNVIPHGVVKQGVRDLRIEDSRFEADSTVGRVFFVYLKAGKEGMTVKNVVVSGNEVVDRGAASQAVGVYVLSEGERAGAVDEVVIEDNVFRGLRVGVEVHDRERGRLLGSVEMRHNSCLECASDVVLPPLPR